MACSPSLEVPTLNTAARTPAVFDDDDIECRQVVQFDDTCVLIPDPVVQSRMPRLVKKSYSLPLWRRRSSSNPPLDVAEVLPGTSSPTEEKSGMVFTVSVPRSVPCVVAARVPAQ